MKVCRRETFNAAHRLHNPSLTDKQNTDLFDKCNNPNYHGHNYVLETFVDGPIDPITGYVIDLKILSDIIKDEVLEAFDHQNLNLDCPEFENLIPTAENIAVIIWNKLRLRLDAKFELEIRLWETDRNSVIYAGK
ncbi:MAG: 6-carboxytetrahydropterin synthase [Crocinitomicaceae bacterium]|nr:6-carboxytetrahydropterin synthase [Crocinitomicaceae bacterium]